MSQPTVNRWLRGIRQIFKYREHSGKGNVKFIGQDHLGNKYYEAFKPNNSMRPTQRYFEHPKMESFDDVVDAAHVPPLWNSWLRFRRRDPPTEGEVQESENYFKMQQAMAAERKAQELVQSKEDTTNKDQPAPNRGSLKRPDRFPSEKVS